jgi:branched-chain amino acid transport system substrate-binding protein
MTLPALLRRAAAGALLLGCAAAHADLKVGVDLSSTGPAAAIGITSKNAILMWPKTIAGQPVQLTVLDDASDPGAAVRNIRKLVDEDHVDVVVGPNITPAALAALDAVAASQTPMITLVGSGAIVEPQEAAHLGVQDGAATARDVMTRFMANHGVKTVGFIGFADSYGDSWLNEFTRFAEIRKIRVIATERFNRTDASVTGQALKLIAAKPDAV